MSDYEKEFIKRVRKEIALFHLSLDAVGKMIGMTRQSLSKILNCKVDSIRADTMLKLSRMFCLSIDEIVGLEEAKKEAEKIASEFVAYEVERAAAGDALQQDGTARSGSGILYAGSRGSGSTTAAAGLS